MPDSPSERPLTPAERALSASIFGPALALDPVRIRHRRWWPLQPRNVVMAPRGHIHFHPDGDGYRPASAQAISMTRGCSSTR